MIDRCDHGESVNPRCISPNIDLCEAGYAEAVRETTLQVVAPAYAMLRLL
jgi:hypothetical protein